MIQTKDWRDFLFREAEGSIIVKLKLMNTNIALKAARKTTSERYTASLYFWIKVDGSKHSVAAVDWNYLISI